ncbi:methyl-accepting chemotaxis protein [Paenibacillus monticola]|nr:methyl-accepting chemotaxis protein [Paenibacillus monticola]
MSKLNNSVRVKLLSVLLIPILALVVTSYLSLSLVKSSNHNLKRVLYDNGYQLTNYMINADRDMYQAYSAVQLYLSTGDKLALDDYHTNVSQINERLGNAEGILNSYNDPRMLDLKSENGNNIQKNIADATAQFNEWVGIIDTQLLAPVGKSASVTNELLRVDQFSEARENLDSGTSIVEIFMDQEVKNSEHSISRSLTTVISISITLLLLSFIMSYIYIGRISKAFKMIREVMEKLANGDLTAQPLKLRSKDEIGQVAEAINNMTEIIKALIGKIIGLSQSVSIASKEISMNTEEVVKSSTYQANDAQTMTLLVQELTLAVASVAHNAEKASTMYKQTADITSDSMHVVDASINEMNAASVQMTNLQRDSKKIGNILSMINDIADQTNLLALNAAIEAARAGEQGRGFAVVADEVRKLAERSGEATRQIAEIIDTMQENTVKSVSAVETGVRSSLEAALAFKKIKEMVNDTAQFITEIAAASEEQAVQADDVLQSVQSIAAASQQVSACAEQTAASSHNLVESTVQLNKSLEAFRIS